MSVSYQKEALSIIASEVVALMPTYPSWVRLVLATAIPTNWDEAMATNLAFLDSEMNRKASIIMPDWCTTAY